MRLLPQRGLPLPFCYLSTTHIQLNCHCTPSLQATPKQPQFTPLLKNFSPSLGVFIPQIALSLMFFSIYKFQFSLVIRCFCTNWLFIMAASSDRFLQTMLTTQLVLQTSHVRRILQTWAREEGHFKQPVSSVPNISNVT